MNSWQAYTQGAPWGQAPQQQLSAVPLNGSPQMPAMAMSAPGKFSRQGMLGRYLVGSSVPNSYQNGSPANMAHGLY